MNLSSYTQNLASLEAKLKTSTKTGLSAKDAEELLNLNGYNELTGEKQNWLRILARQFNSPFIYLLLVATIISFLLGESIDGLMIIGFIFINTLLGFYQEYHSFRTLKLLEKFTTPHAKVIRDNKVQVILSRDIVVGDCVIIEAGDIIPADLRFFEEDGLTIDESVLTGESIGVTKTAVDIKQEISEYYQAHNLGFGGTKVVSGSAKGIVYACGRYSVMGEISKLTSTTQHESSFEKGLKKFSYFILKLVVITLFFVFITNLAIKGSGNLGNFLIFAIALAVSVIPEALPLVTTFSLSRGALKLAKNKVVVKRLSAVEDLGSIEVLASDKTGTLTENKLSLADIFGDKKEQIFRTACLACDSLDNQKKDANNSFDLALISKLSDKSRKLLKKIPRIKEMPFDPERRCNSVLIFDNKKYQLIIRGAPEVLLNLSTNISVDEHLKIKAWLSEQGRNGRRVLGVASRSFFKEPQKELVAYEQKLTFHGIIAFVDPIKKTASKAVSQAKELGVAVKIITGDSSEVSGAVAKQIGLVENEELVLTGDGWTNLTLNEKKEYAWSYQVFARFSPQHKHELIKILAENHDVGFLGEGINDAPALKAANVSLVVPSASEIAKDAADIILLERNLLVIVEGIKLGREVFANTIKYIKTTLASNFGNFYAVAISSLFIDFLPMLPIQILLLNFLSDFPMIAIAADNVDSFELKRPRSYNVREVAFFATTMGVVSTIFDFLFFAFFYQKGESVLQTNWFIGSILTELAIIFCVRSQFFMFKAKRPSKIVISLAFLAAMVTCILPFTPFGQQFLKFTPPLLDELIIIISLVGSYLFISEGVKLAFYRFIKITHSS